MTSPTDWGRGGRTGFLRDPGNEQATPLAANATFTGAWMRVDKIKAFAALYGTHVPFTMQIQWSADGVTQDLDPFATITPQVRNRLGLYSVISFQSTFFRPFARIRIINGPSPQLFVVSDMLLLDTVFGGYLIDVDGPIPALGLGMLDVALGWGRSPTAWSPIQLTAALNQKTAIAEDLIGLATDAKLDAVIAKLDAVMTALEQTTVVLDAASLASLESITVQNNVSTDMLDRVGRLLGVISGTVAVSNWPAVQPVSGAFYPAVQPVSGTVVATPATFSKTHGVGTGAPQTIKVGPGTLHAIVAKAGPTMLLYDDPGVGVTNKFLDLDFTGSGSYLGPLDIAFTAGLRVTCQNNKLYTVIWN